MIYKDRLRYLRESEAISQQELGVIININRKTYQHYETEYAIIPLMHLNSICNYFNVSLDYIFNFTDIKNYHNYTKKIDSKTCGTRLKEFRKENKLTQDKLANLLNIDQPVIANYENGKHLIATPFLYEICKKYNISADYLLGKVDEPKYLKQLIL